MTGPMDTASSRPWRMVMPLIAVVCLCILWSIFWFVASGIVQEQVATARATAARSGLSLACASETWGGYPFRFEFTCASPVIEARQSHRLEAGRLEAVAQAYYPWHVLVLVDGPTQVSSVKAGVLRIDHGRAITSFRFRDGPEPEFSLEIPKVRIPDLFNASEVLLHTRPEPEGAHGVAVSMSGVHHQREGHPPLDVDSATLLASLSRSLVLDVHNVDLKRQDVTWHGTGTIQLDPGKRIAGILHTTTNSLDGLLAILEPHIKMTDQQRTAFKAVMGLLGQQAKADIIAKNGELYIGPFKIADLMPID